MNFVAGNRKRKLEYGHGNEIQGSLEKSPIFKQDVESIKIKSGDWERAGEGFSGFTSEEISKPVKRRSLQKRHPQKYTICMPCDSETEAKVENVITWSSSDEDSLSLKSDFESNIVEPRPKRTNTWKKRVMNENFSRNSWQENIDFHDSDDEQSEKMYTSTTDKAPQVEADLIEDADSRSSFTFSSSSICKTDKKTDIDVVDGSDDIIQTLSSVETPASSPDKKGRVKASVWVKSLDLKTPTKQSPTITITDDSAKKKKKYTRNGLADQLYKLQIREKSSVRVWNHQSSTENKVSHKSILLKVQDFEILYSLQLARCKEIKTTVDSSMSKEDEVYALFTSEMAEDMNITAGSVVRVYPPWQNLKLQSLQKTVLLCTYYIKIEGNEDVIDPTRETSKHTMIWKCPCVTGLVKNYRQCPAFQFPCFPGISTISETKMSDSCGVPEGSNTEHSLYMIQATQSSGTMVSNVSDSVLESIDRSSVQSGINFKGLIHRVFCKTSVGKETGKRYSLLVEDGHGIMCEIQVPEDTDMFDGIIQNGEGNSYIFSGLKVLTRVTRDRDPALFCMIDTVWSGSCFLAVSEESQTHTSSSVLPPGFCYYMVEHNNPGIDFKVTQSLSSVSVYRKTQLVTLQSISQVTIDLTRLTAKVKLLSKIHKSNLKDLEKIDFASLVYVRDSSLNIDDYKLIKVKEGCCLQEHSDIVVRDVLWSSGSLICDCYSQIIPYSDSVYEKFVCGNLYTSQLLPFCLPTLTDVVELYNLLSIKGTISEIDESSAYSWDVCDKCESDKLAEKSTTKELVCLNCKQVVQQPNTKMKMEVYISLGKVVPYRLRVDLSEDTIQCLLPEDDNDDEGYDIGSVLNCEVGPLSCIVINKSTKEILLKEIKLSI